MSLNSYPQNDFSGAVQSATSYLMKKQNELANVRNARFGVELGSIVRRNGHTRAGSTFGTTGQNTPTGGFIANYSTGNKRFVAVNNNAGTKTIIRVQDSAAGTWTTLTTDIPINAKVFFFLWLDEVYITGYDPATGDPITPYNVDKTLDISTTRNILNMPACRFLAEYNGALFAANVKIGSERFRDRAYKSSGPLGAITFVNSAQTGLLTQIVVDSMRYIKVGMALDIYAAGTDTKKYDLTVTAVDKANSRFSFSPANQAVSMANVDVPNNIITVATTSHLPTGTPVQISSTSGVPGGLTAGVTYYVINVSGTTIKLATTALNATNNVPVDITSTGATQTFATSAVDTATEIITLASTSTLSTGMPIVFTSTTTVPAGLTSGTVYYAIVLSSTTIKVATSVANAEAGTAVNITSQGTGTHTISSGAHTLGVSFSLADNDEIWLDGRKGKTTMFWNTDFPTPENADWTATRPGVGSSNEITAMAKSSNRLFLYTLHSSQKFDGSNTVPFNNVVGCISQNSLKNIDDDWLVWVDARGRVWARNESTGQQEYISRGIYSVIMKYVSQANLANSHAGVNNNHYTLYIGQNNVGKGNEYLRIVYSFDDNIWSIDRLQFPVMFQGNDDYTGENKPYFFSTDGYLYMDDIGNLDHDKAIPLEIEVGRDHLGSPVSKRYDGLFVFSKNAAGMVVKVSVGGGQPKTVGQITKEEEYLKFPRKGEEAIPDGVTVNVFLSGASKGDPQYIRGTSLYFNPTEDTPSGKAIGKS